MNEVWVVQTYNFNDDFTVHDGKVLFASKSLYSACEYCYTDAITRYNAQGKRLEYDADDNEWFIEVKSGLSFYCIVKVEVAG